MTLKISRVDVSHCFLSSQKDLLVKRITSEGTTERVGAAFAFSQSDWNCQNPVYPTCPSNVQRMSSSPSRTAGEGSHPLFRNMARSAIKSPPHEVRSGERCFADVLAWPGLGGLCESRRDLGLVVMVKALIN